MMPTRPKTHLQRIYASRPPKPIDASPRPSSSAQGYGRNWRRLRLLVLSEQPVCADCQRAPATEVDHILSKRKGGTDARANLVGLCCSCHSRKTCRDDGAGWKRNP